MNILQLETLVIAATIAALFGILLVIWQKHRKTSSRIDLSSELWEPIPCTDPIVNHLGITFYVNRVTEEVFMTHKYGGLLINEGLYGLEEKKKERQ
jgi:hypothetical protein